MNLIRCSADCRHQTEGLCGLTGASAVGELKGDCCFYEKAEKISPTQKTQD